MRTPPLERWRFFLENEQQSDYREDGFVIMRFSILSRRDLTPSEKLVYARICGFKKYFESAETCAETIGVSVSSVQKAKQKLVAIGYVSELANTGRGKIYKAVYDVPVRLAKSANQTSKKPPVRLAKSANIEERENKEENKVKSTNVDLAKAANLAVENSKKPEIEELHAYWQVQLGYPISSKVKQNRYACNNLLKKFGVEGVQQLIRAVQGTQEDKYAPAISDFATLQNKLNDLLAWAKRQKGNDVQHF